MGNDPRVSVRKVDEVHAGLDEPHRPELAHDLHLMIVDVLAVLGQAGNGNHLLAALDGSDDSARPSVGHHNVARVHVCAKRLTV